jgi:glycosyltransferase involved in cell wall biosynthesis
VSDATSRSPAGRVRVALFAASPVYYQAPLYRLLAADPRIDFTAVFASSSGVRPGELGFGRPVSFGTEVLEGYRSHFLRRADTNEVHRRGLLRLRDPDVVTAVARGRYDVLWLHGYDSLTHLLAAATQLLSRRALLYREDATLLNPRPARRRALKRLLLPLLFRRARALAVGSENRRWFQSFGVRPELIFSVPYAVENDRLQEQAAELEPSRSALRRALGVAEDGGPVILCVARLVAKKEPLLLLEAFRRARAGRRCTLLLVGSGELEEEVQSEMRRSSIPDVVLTGFLSQAEIVRAYAAADVFVLPSSHDETWGLVVNEAMNFALPIVVSDKVGSAADLVVDGDNGFVVPAGDVDALAERLALLADDPALRQRLGSSSRARIEQWTYDAALEGLLEAIADAVGESRWQAAARSVRAAKIAS